MERNLERLSTRPSQAQRRSMQTAGKNPEQQICPVQALMIRHAFCARKLPFRVPEHTCWGVGCAALSQCFSWGTAGSAAPTRSGPPHAWHGTALHPCSRKHGGRARQRFVVSELRLLLPPSGQSVFTVGTATFHAGARHSRARRPPQASARHGRAKRRNQCSTGPSAA